MYKVELKYHHARITQGRVSCNICCIMFQEPVVTLHLKGDKTTA